MSSFKFTVTLQKEQSSHTCCLPPVNIPRAAVEEPTVTGLYDPGDKVHITLHPRCVFLGSGQLYNALHPPLQYCTQ